MKTTIDIPEKDLEDAMRFTGAMIPQPSSQLMRKQAHRARDRALPQQITGSARW